MSARKLKEPILIREVPVVDITADGRGIAKADGKAIFVKDTIPGDCIDLEVTRRKGTLFEGRLLGIQTPSEQRADPFCAHFGSCGGCKWQHLSYEAQLHYKQKQVKDALERIAGVDTTGMAPIKPAPETVYYRNKLEFTFSNKRWLTREDMAAQEGEDPAVTHALGFHVPGRFDKIVDVSHCWLQQEPSNTIRNLVREYALSRGLSFYDLKAHKGLLRNLIIRTASTGEVMVIVVFAEKDPGEIEALMSRLAEQVPGIDALLYVINRKRNDTIFDQEVICYRGRDHIFEKMDTPAGQVRYKIGPKSFYQTNSGQAQALYETAAEFAGLTGRELVYDLYTGAGTIASFIAPQAREVIGIEYVPAAIEDARENAGLNGITNTRFFAGDLKEVLTGEFVQQHGRPDVVITDPPRAGMHPDVTARLLETAPEKIVYVSCNPATQARDLQLLKTQYKISRIQPVDMFPHTTHVENVVLLENQEPIPRTREKTE